MILWHMDQLPLDNVVSLDQVSAERVTSESIFSGIITVKWPISQFEKSVTFLLGNKDSIKRLNNKEEIMVIVRGSLATRIINTLPSGSDFAIRGACQIVLRLIGARSTSIQQVTFESACDIYVSRYEADQRVLTGYRPSRTTYGTCSILNLR